MATFASQQTIGTVSVEDVDVRGSDWRVAVKIEDAILYLTGPEAWDLVDKLTVVLERQTGKGRGE